MTDKCRSCQAEIVWGTTENGKPVPLDAKPELRLAPRLLFDEAVRPARGNELRPDDADVRMVMVRVWTNHFVTCPDRDQHRKSTPSSMPFRNIADALKVLTPPARTRVVAFIAAMFSEAAE